MARKPKPKPEVDPVLARLFAEFGVPTPEREHRFHPTRKWRFDYAWPEQRVALEVEGGVWTRGRHTRGAGFVRDMDKYNEATRLGWKLVRVLPDQLHSGYTAQLVRDTMYGSNGDGE